MSHDGIRIAHLVAVSPTLYISTSVEWRRNSAEISPESRFVLIDLLRLKRANG
jgi:hypothetical protein